MKTIPWVILGIAALVLLGFAVLLLWGSWAFSPKDQPHLRRLAEGDLADGTSYEITSHGRTFAPASYCVNIGTHESGRNTCAVFVEEGGPKPKSVRRPESPRLEVEFERPLADGSWALTVALAEDHYPGETVIVNALGTVRREAIR